MTDGSLVMLVVEDNPADVLFFQEAVDAAGLSARLHIVDNGGDAIAFLRRQKQFAEAPRPDVVVLDLNIPVRNGREVLRDMMGDDSLSRIPVAILTTSTSERDMTGSYTHGLCRYFVKTPDFKALTSLAVEIHNFALRLRSPA